MTEIVKGPFKSAGNIFLLIASLLFYAWGEPRFVFVMLASIVINYLSAWAINSCKKKKYKIVFLSLSIAINLGILIYYKYVDFFVTNVNRVFHTQIPLFDVVLPIGISFFTFQAMSYVIDVYRKTVSIQKNPLTIGLYISFFPQLIAGPIVRYSTIENQIHSRQHTWEKFSEGCFRFIIGLAKKIILANNVAQISDAAFAAPSDERGVIFAWVGALAYSLQIYFDFSGYSDMAIGLGKMFGFEFLENFDLPYISKTISEFWRRWHISLGQWFRDYVYFPLGGSRVKKKSRLIFNLFLVWTLTGLWHGANWTFVFWGLLHFIFIAIEKLFNLQKLLENCRVGQHLYRIVTLLVILLGWVLFRADSIHVAGNYILSMLGLKGGMLFSVETIYQLREYGFFLVAAVICSTELPRKFKTKLSAFSAMKIPMQIFTAAGMIFLFGWSLSFIEMGAHNPFIYFNF